MDRALGPANNSPVLVEDPTDDRFVVMANRLDAPDFSCALQASGDGGRGWVTLNPVLSLPPGADKCYAPEVAFDRAGTLHYLFVGLEEEGNEPMGAFLTASRDRGHTWSPPTQVLGPLSFGVRLAIDLSASGDGRLHLVWLEATSDPPLGGFGPPPNPILASYSDDGGRSFSEPVQVSDPGRDRVVAPALSIGRDGTVHVAYYDLLEDARDYQGLEGPTWEGTWAVVLASSFDAGTRFDAGVVVDDGIVPFERPILIFTMAPPSLASDQDGRVCTAWTDARFGDADAVVRCSPDQGRRWEQVQRINDDPIGNGSTQYLPRLSIAPGGRLDVVFYDRRSDPQDVAQEVSFTSSEDGGRSFIPNRTISAEPSDSRVGAQYANVSAQGKHDFGARLALLSTNSKVLAAWPDTRNSEPGSTGQDLFAAEVSLPASGPPVERLGGAILLGGGLMFAAAVASRPSRRRPQTTDVVS